MATHHFQPTHYFNTIGSHDPVLHVQPGDTIITTTVDNRGQDATGHQATPPGNPMTGPFFVEGAEIEDTLIVHFDKLTCNRPIGYSRKMVSANVVDLDFVPNLPWTSEEDALATWAIDDAAGTATLIDPANTAIGQIQLPLAPMVGCFGVAPARGEVISNATSSHHGGNMDYRGFVEGVTVYLPVLTDGALFHIGDGHALQGDGEIVGTGIEISFDVEFTLDLQKGRTIYWPRGENEDYIFTAGNARPLDQATQHATTEMIRWLTDECGLDPVGAHILLGQVVEYDLGSIFSDIFDPAYTMICKVPKAVLAALR